MTTTATVTVVWLLCFGAVLTRQEQEKELTRSLNSVDIQLCVDGVLSSAREGVLQAMTTQLQFALATTAVYYARFYTLTNGDVCFLFVHQSPNPDAARNAIQLLLSRGDNTFSVTYNSFILPCRIAAAAWQGEEPSPLGFEVSAIDVLTWGGCVGGVIAFCAVGVCCFVQLSRRKEARALLLADEHLHHAVHHPKKKKDIMAVAKT